MERGIALTFQKNSLTTVLVKRLVLILSGSIALFALFYYFVFPTYYYWRLERPVKQTEQLIQQAHQHYPAEVVVTSTPIADLTDTSATEELALRLERQGIRLNKFWISQETLDAVANHQTSQRLFQQTKQSNDFYARFFVYDQRLYLVGTSIPNFTQTAETLLPLVIAATLFFLLLVIIWLVAAIKKQLIQPIKELEQATRQIAHLDFSTNPQTAVDELDALTDSIATMQQSLQKHEAELVARNQQLKDFSANLAHELKTPLAVMQLLVDSEKLGLENPTLLPELTQQLNQMNELITQLLTYSQQLQQENARETVELMAFFDQQQITRLAPDFALQLQIEPVILQTNEALLQLIVQNLITNAVKYSVAPQLVITGAKVKTGYQLCFVNQAEPIPSDLFEQLEKPFVVGENSRNARLSGHGLGLTIASQAATALGGRLQFEQSDHRFKAILFVPE